MSLVRLMLPLITYKDHILPPKLGKKKKNPKTNPLNGQIYKNFGYYPSIIFVLNKLSKTIEG